jgi:ferric-dicitrate binding protein FerR (iron transport regulator)
MTTETQREHEAAYWLIEQEGASFSEEQRTALSSWLSRSAANRETYMALERSWHRTLILRRQVPAPGVGAGKWN